MLTACFRAAACIVPFGRVLAGFFVMGLCAAERAQPPPSWRSAGTRCRTMAPHPVLGRPGTVSGRAVARDRRGPSMAPLAPLVRFQVREPRRRGSAPQPRRERGVGTRGPRAARVTEDSYLVDPASSHMLVSKIKPCMCKYKLSCTVKLRMAH